jgi:hypothetical protein
VGPAFCPATAGHANRTEMSSLSRPGSSPQKPSFTRQAGKECTAVFESIHERRRSDIISYFPRNSTSTHTHVFPVTPRMSRRRRPSVSEFTPGHGDCHLTETLYTVTAVCHSAHTTIPATPEYVFCAVSVCSDSPAGLGDDHLCAQLVELVPQVLILQMTLDAGQILAVAAAFQVVGKGIGRRVICG